MDYTYEVAAALLLGIVFLLAVIPAVAHPFSTKDRETRETQLRAYRIEYDDVYEFEVLANRRGVPIKKWAPCQSCMMTYIERKYDEEVKTIFEELRAGEL